MYLTFDIETFLCILAAQFAIEMGFENMSLSSNHSLSEWQKWKDRNCQPNH